MPAASDPSASPRSDWSPDPADYRSRDYLDRQEDLAEIHARARHAACQDKLAHVRRRLRYEAMVSEARAAGEPYVLYEDYREPGDEEP